MTKVRTGDRARYLIMFLTGATRPPIYKRLISGQSSASFCNARHIGRCLVENTAGKYSHTAYYHLYFDAIF
jgi:hypothetical protein